MKKQLSIRTMTSVAVLSAVAFVLAFFIEQEHCLHCGNCMKVCPVGAMQKR